MAYHKRWTNTDLVSAMIKADYPGFKELETFLTVLYKGDFYTLSLIQKDDERKAVFSQRKCDKCVFYFETVKVISFNSKDEGNNFYKKLKATKKTSKNNFFYYTVD